jgi:V8-like Glu-specific endopeptidase
MFAHISHALRLCAALCLLASGASGDVLPPLPKDEATKWRAIGVVNIEGVHGLARCTGTLIAPGLVLTAAHCTPKDPTKRMFVVDGSDEAFAIKDVKHHPAYAAAAGFAKYRVDQALITLQDPVPPDLAAPLPLSENTQVGEALAILGYHRLRPGHLNGRFDCPRVEGDDLIVNCQVIAGNSGAPALSQTRGGWQIAGVVVARLDSGTDRHALVAPINAWVRAKLAAHQRRSE